MKGSFHHPLRFQASHAGGREDKKSEVQKEVLRQGGRCHVAREGEVAPVNAGVSLPPALLQIASSSAVSRETCLHVCPYVHGPAQGSPSQRLSLSLSNAHLEGGSSSNKHGFIQLLSKSSPSLYKRVSNLLPILALR